MQTSLPKTVDRSLTVHWENKKRQSCQTGPVSPCVTVVVPKNLILNSSRGVRMTESTGVSGSCGWTPSEIPRESKTNKVNYFLLRM